MYSPGEFGKLIGRSVNTLQQWDRKGILKAQRSPTNRRYYTNDQYLEYLELVAKEQGKTMVYARVSGQAQKTDIRILLIGMKGCGKTTIGRLLAEKLRVPFIDSDTEIEQMHRRERSEALSSGQILKQYGETYFHALEIRALKHVAREIEKTDFVFACGGRTPLQEENQEILPQLGTIIFLHTDKVVLLKRILAQGIPSFFPYQDDAEKSLDELLTQRMPAYKKLADLTIVVGEGTPEEVMHTILTELRAYDQN